MATSTAIETTTPVSNEVKLQIEFGVQMGMADGLDYLKDMASGERGVINKQAYKELKESKQTPNMVLLTEIPLRDVAISGAKWQQNDPAVWFVEPGILGYEPKYSRVTDPQLLSGQMPPVEETLRYQAFEEKRKSPTNPNIIKYQLFNPQEMSAQELKSVRNAIRDCQQGNLTEEQRKHVDVCGEIAALDKPNAQVQPFSLWIKVNERGEFQFDQMPLHERVGKDVAEEGWHSPNNPPPGDPSFDPIKYGEHALRRDFTPENIYESLRKAKLAK